VTHVFALKVLGRRLGRGGRRGVLILDGLHQQVAGSRREGRAREEQRRERQADCCPAKA
jgi:hypothetical protein